MMTVHRMFDIELKPGEFVVSATAFRDYLIVVTDRGTVYKVVYEGP